METQAETNTNEKTQIVRIPIGDIVSPIVIRLEPVVDAAGVTTLMPHVSIEGKDATESQPSESVPAAVAVESPPVGEIGERKILKLTLRSNRQKAHDFSRGMNAVDNYIYANNK